MNLRPVFLFFSFLFSIGLFAQDGLKTKEVSIFKDGSAFIFKSGRVNTESGSYIIREDIPPAVFGTLWLYSPGAGIKGVSSFVEEKEIQEDYTHLLSILAANRGKQVKVILNTPMKSEERVEYTGKIVQVSKEVVSIQSGGNWLSFKAQELNRVQFLEAPVLKKDVKKTNNVLQVDFKDSKAIQSLEMMYLRSDLGWLPNYLVELWGEEKATLTLRGMIFNQAEDIENADINFVLGIPNFLYRYRQSPIASKAAFSSFSYELAANLKPGSPNPMLNAIDPIPAQQTYGNYSNNQEFDNRSTTAAIESGDAEGEGEEDLFFYNLKGITLKKGGHGIYDIFKAEIDCQHIYDAKIDPNVPAYSWYAQYNQEEYKIRDVYHSIKLKNNTSFPWTTGSVLVTRSEEGDYKPLSEDKLEYTPVSGNAYIKLTISPDVMVKDSEREKNRQENKKTRNRVKYDLLTIEGTIQVKNYKDKPINLNVKRLLTGMPKKSEPLWLLEEKFKQRGRELNERYDVCWELKLKAGEEKKIVYTYDVFVPR